MAMVTAARKEDRGSGGLDMIISGGYASQKRRFQGKRGKNAKERRACSGCHSMPLVEGILSPNLFSGPTARSKALAKALKMDSMEW